MLASFAKAKNNAKNFKLKEQAQQRQNENLRIVRRIKSVEATVRNSSPEDRGLNSRNKSLSQIKSKEVVQENMRLANKIINSRVDVKQYRKRMEQEIQNYLALRNNIRKCVYVPVKKPKIAKTEVEANLFENNQCVPGTEIRTSKKSNNSKSTL